MTDDAHDKPTPENAGASVSERPNAPFTVLIPLDGSELAEAALPVAARMCAAIPGSELICMRALPVTALPYGLTTLPPYIPGDVYQRMWDDQERLASEYLTAAIATIASYGVRARAVTQRGDASSTILDTATRLRVNLIVMTTHGRTGLARFTLGSVADRIVRASVAPVLLLRSFAAQHQSADAFQHVLTPIDGSERAETPLHTIIPQLAGSVIKRVTLLQVVDPREGEEAVRRAEASLAHAQQRLQERLGGRSCAVETQVRAGAVAATILACAQELSCTAIVMASRSEMGIGRLALGGVTDRILRDGQTALLLTHSES